VKREAAMSGADLFESRKRDHIRIALDPRSQATEIRQVKNGAGFDRVQLIHEALPDFNFSDIQIAHSYFGQAMAAPFFISSMTAGHQNGVEINRRLARLASLKSWMMGVGSQRRELSDPEAAKEWEQIRHESPHAVLLGNLGIAQVIQTPLVKIQKLVDSLEAKALFVHLNALQECLQPEGTPSFAGGWKALEGLVKGLSVPVLVKETGCGFSLKTCQRLKEIGAAAVDVSGFGGTHWGRVEGFRSQPGSPAQEAAQVFKDWGIPTVTSLMNAKEIFPSSAIWASGGIRSGLDAAKLLAMGATAIGIAQPLLAAALESEEALARKMEQFEFELKIALFCTGVQRWQDFENKKVWTWN
jgi:isopentenyl-diphosphate delta-isomerase